MYKMKESVKKKLNNSRLLWNKITLYCYSKQCEIDSYTLP